MAVLPSPASNPGPSPVPLPLGNGVLLSGPLVRVQYALLSPARQQLKRLFCTGCYRKELIKVCKQKPRGTAEAFLQALWQHGSQKKVWMVLGGRSSGVSAGLLRACNGLKLKAGKGCSWDLASPLPGLFLGSWGNPCLKTHILHKLLLLSTVQ